MDIDLKTLHDRLIRMESRLCQLMQHQGLNPYDQGYALDAEDNITYHGARVKFEPVAVENVEQLSGCF